MPANPDCVSCVPFPHRWKATRVTTSHYSERSSQGFGTPGFSVEGLVGVSSPSRVLQDIRGWQAVSAEDDRSQRTGRAAPGCAPRCARRRRGSAARGPAQSHPAAAGSPHPPLPAASQENDPLGCCYHDSLASAANVGASPVLLRAYRSRSWRRVQSLHRVRSTQNKEPCVLARTLSLDLQSNDA